MNALLRTLVLAGGISFAMAGSLGAAPISPTERTDLKSLEQHNMRDVRTGDFRPHGTLTTQQRRSLASEDVPVAPKAPAQPITLLPLHAPN